MLLRNTLQSYFCNLKSQFQHFLLLKSTTSGCHTDLGFVSGSNDHLTRLDIDLCHAEDCPLPGTICHGYGRIIAASKSRLVIEASSYGIEKYPCQRRFFATWPGYLVLHLNSSASLSARHGPFVDRVVQ